MPCCDVRCDTMGRSCHTCPEQHSLLMQVNADLLAAAQAKHADEGPLQLDLDDKGRPGFPQV